ncbi:PepSY-associated TM helix domain-containing protein [Ralstonia soli]|uniref:PepSY-associated TM helix domain-containing protein n=1 Tax=Ralstonia soli TaxID=2953896 RepID=A0ABT1AQD0_9RALS|nr:PepSY-associated TM helix domain-containing protein [Ralstonia soli]MCO5400664.1 PepSY-associated TM helix domain-containing protein [Ralstonia soli]
MNDLSHPSLSAPSAAPAHPAKTKAKAEHPANHRATAVRWLRKTHGWFGLWGAVLGLIFGVSGIWLNHRAVMKLPVAQQKTTTRIALADPLPATPEAMSAYLQQTLQLQEPPNRIRVERAKPVPWTEPADTAQGEHEHRAAKPLMQPAQWSFSFGNAGKQMQIEYWVGNHSAEVRQTDNGIVATLNNLHKGTGMTVPWILLVDTLAGCLILLSLSGLALWVMTTKRRTVGWTIFGLGSALAIGLAISRL